MKDNKLNTETCKQIRKAKMERFYAAHPKWKGFMPWGPYSKEEKEQAKKAYDAYLQETEEDKEP